MMWPLPRSSMCGRNARMPRTTPSKLMANDHSQSATEICSSAPRSTTPALFIAISTCPISRSAVAPRRSTSASLDTSQCTARARLPNAAMAARVSSSRRSLTSAMTRSAPCRAMASAVPRPIPLAPPVTTATFPASCTAPNPFLPLLTPSRGYCRHHVVGDQFQRLEVRRIVVLEYQPLDPFVRQRPKLRNDLVRRADYPAVPSQYLGHRRRVERGEARDQLLHHRPAALQCRCIVADQVGGRHATADFVGIAIDVTAV